MKNNLLIFSGNANKKLAADICKFLKVKLADAAVDHFSDGEIRAKINANVRGHDVFVVQPTCTPSNDNLMELLQKFLRLLGRMDIRLGNNLQQGGARTV